MITPVGFCPVCTDFLDTCVCLYPGLPKQFNPLPLHLRQLRLGLRLKECTYTGGHVWVEHGMAAPNHVCVYCRLATDDLVSWGP